ncbi:hypothetical protein SNE40_013353 [Patella caerulea]|uniref:Poly [ADP-ribose] polymerase n=1 Tax=Patella caerulea TaxID=87958 RepID=A0AAN8JKW4_PATCE
MLRGDNLHASPYGSTTENKTASTVQIKPQVQVQHQAIISDNAKIENQPTPEPFEGLKGNCFEQKVPIDVKIQQPNMDSSVTNEYKQRHPKSRIFDPTDTVNQPSPATNEVLMDNYLDQTRPGDVKIQQPIGNSPETDANNPECLIPQKQPDSMQSHVQVQQNKQRSSSTISTEGEPEIDIDGDIQASEMGKEKETAVVLQNNNSLNNQLLTVKVYEEEVQELKSIKVFGFKTANFELMDMYFTNKKKCGAEADKVELSEDEEYLFVTFKTTEDAELVCNKEHILDGCKLKVELFNPSTQLDNSTHDDGKRIVRVSGYKDTASKDMIEMYIDSEKRFGAVPEKIDINENESYTLVTISTVTDAELVCNKEHILDGCKLTVELFNPSTQLDNSTHDDGKRIVRVSGYKDTASKDMIEMYIDSEKRFGAVPENIDINENESYTLVTLSTVTDAELVCSKEHILDGCKLKVELFNPSTQLDNSTHDDGKRIVRVSGYKDTTSKDMIEMYIDSEKRFGAVPENIDINENESYALVTLSTVTDAELVCNKEHILDGCKLTVELFNPSTQLDNSTHDDGKRIVRVSGYKDTASKDMIEMYIDSEKRFGAVPENIDINENESYALVTLSTVTDAELVCNKEHILDGCKLTVELFNPSTQLDNSTHDDGKRIVRVSGYKDTTSNDMIEMYIDSEKRFGAVPENIDINENESYTLATLSTVTDAELVCNKEHILDGCKLTVELFNPSTQLDNSTHDDGKRIVRVSGYKDTASKDMIEMYIDSEKRFGAVPENININENESYTLATLSTVTDAELVCSKEHILDGCKLTVELFNPSTQLDNSTHDDGKRIVRVSGYRDTTSKDVIEMYIDSEKRFGAVPEKIDINENESYTLVTLSTVTEAELVCSREHKLDGCKLTVELFNPSTRLDNSTHDDGKRIVRVSGYKDTTSNDMIEMYIESKKRFGAVPENININEKENCTFVTLSTEKDVDLVCNREHILDHCHLKVELVEQIHDTDKAVCSSGDEDGKRCIKVSGCTDLKKLKKFIKDKNRFGVMVEDIETARDEMCIYVTLTSDEDVNFVCNREHMLDDCVLKAELYNPLHDEDKSNLDSEDDKPCIKVSGCTDLKKLKKYIKNKNRFGVMVEDIETARDEMCIYVTLSNDEDVDTVRKTSHTVDNCQLFVEICKPMKSSVTDSKTYQESEQKEGVVAKSNSGNSSKQHVAASKIESGDIPLPETKQNGTIRRSEDECEANPELDDQHGDKCVLVRLSGYNESMARHKLTVYIKSKKKFGAAPKDIEFDFEDKCVYVTLSSKQDAEVVCGKTHTLGEVKLNVEVYTPPPRLNNRLLVTNISQDTNKETLQNFLEGKLDMVITDMVFNEDADKVMISFNDKEFTIDEILDKAQILSNSEEYLDKKKLHVATVYASKIVKVSQHGGKLDGDDLSNYFDSYGDVIKIEVNDEDNFALVHFASYADLEKVLAESHKVEEIKLKVDVYQKCLGKSGGITDLDVFSLPTPVKVPLNEDDTLKMMFIYQSETHAKDLQSRMAQCMSRIEWSQGTSESEAILSCTVTKEMKAVRRLIKTWEKSCKINFERYLGGIKLKIIPIAEHRIFDMVSEEISIQDKNCVNIFKSKTSGLSIVVVGCDEPIFEEMASIVQQTKQRIEEDLDRKKQEVTETLETKYPFAVLESFDVIDVIKKRHTHVQITQQSTEGKINFKGTLSEIQPAIDTMNQLLDDLKFTEINDLKKPIIELLQTDDVTDHIRKDKLKKEKKKTAIWKVSQDKGSVFVYAKNAESLKEITDVLRTVCSHKIINVDTQGSDLLTGSAWKDIVKNIHAQYPNLVIVDVIDNKQISLTFITDLSELVDKMISDFLTEHVRCTEILPCSKGQVYFMDNILKKQTYNLISDFKKSGVTVTLSSLLGIRIEGPTGAMDAAKEKLKSYISNIKSAEKNIIKPSELKFYRLDKGRETICTTQNKFNCYIEHSDDAWNLGLTFELKKTKTKIHVVKGDITDTEVDVIVNSANKELIHNGGLANDIVQKGGHTIQDECTLHIKHNGTLSEGDCVMTKPGHLPCKELIHAVGPIWNGGKSEEMQILKDTILKTLEKAFVKGYTCLAIPAFGTGQLGFPPYQAADCIIAAIDDHFSRTPNSPINTIYLIDKQLKPLEHFISKLQGNDSFIAVTSSEISRMNRTTVEHYGHSGRSFVGDQSGSNAIAVDTQYMHIVKSEIAKVQIDVIVNSTSSRLKLSDGAVSGSILREGGQTIQDECNQKYRKGINPGDIAETGPGRLKCKKIFHTCLGPYSGSSEEKQLRKLIKKCLETAEREGYKSIAFPAIGTGNLGFPHDVVAQIFYQTIHDYKSQGGSLQDITIVIYPKDQQTIKAFEAEVNTQGSTKKKIKKGSKKTKPKGAEGYTSIVSPITTSSDADLRQGVEIGRVRFRMYIGNIINSSVGAIVNGSNSNLDLTKGAVSKEILKRGGENLYEECRNQAATMRDKGIAVTTCVGEMQCKCVIHIDVSRFGSELKNIMIECLKVADARMCTSIAFPALAIGVGGKVEDVAKSIFEAVCEASEILSTVKDVQLVIFDQPVLNAFNKAFQTLFNEKGEPGKKSYFQMFTNYVSSYMPSAKSSPMPSSQGELPRDMPPRLTSDSFKPIKLTVYSFEENSDKQSTWVIDIIKELDHQYAHATSQSQLTLYKNLCKVEQTKIKNLENFFPLDIAIHPSLNVITIFGLVDDVLDVVDQIRKISETVISEQNKREFAEIQQNVDVAGIDARIPNYWAKDVTGNLNVITLEESSDEYKEVEKNFRATLGRESAKITQIERIQNLSLFQQYVSKKGQMKQDLPNTVVVEKEVLWHGTDSAAVNNINKNGFSRSYCGKNAVAYGEGVYFAVNSSYSYDYAEENSDRFYQMYQCRVLIGDYTRGKHGCRQPEINPKSQLTFHSLVDDVENPTMHIIFHDTQAYPDYLISFTK